MTGPVKSPCNNVCQLDWQSGYCLGCGRTGTEIAAWPSLTDEARDAVMALLPGRLEAMALPADPAARQEEGERRARRQRLGNSDASS